MINDQFEAEQRQVEATLYGIMEAAQRKDFARLAGYHLHSPKFTKFDDFEPLDRQDAATAQRSEEEGLGAVENFRYRLDDLKSTCSGRSPSPRSSSTTGSKPMAKTCRYGHAPPWFSSPTETSGRSPTSTSLPSRRIPDHCRTKVWRNRRSGGRQ